MTRASRTVGSASAALTASFLLTFVASPALAGLGGDVSSIEHDRVQMRGARQVTTSASGYTVDVITTPGNTVVREYVSPAGRVFAVSWHGPLLPDLRETLGSYFTQFEQAAGSPHSGHRHLSIQQPDLVVSSHGHMRAFFGRAWVPSLLPPNFQVDEIK